MLFFEHRIEVDIVEYNIVFAKILRLGIKKKKNSVYPWLTKSCA